MRVKGITRWEERRLEERPDATGWCVGFRIGRAKFITTAHEYLSWSEAAALADEMLTGWPRGVVETYYYHHTSPTFMVEGYRRREIELEIR